MTAPAELSSLIRKALISLYPGTSYEESLSSAYGTVDSFFMSRNEGDEILWICVTAEMLETRMVESASGRARELEWRIRESRPEMKRFSVSVFTPRLEEKLRREAEGAYEGWSFFEYWQLQSETEEGLALKKWERRLPQAAEAPAPEAQPRPEPQPDLPLPVERDVRLTPDELNTLIDLSLGLQLRSRGLTWDDPRGA